MYINLNRKKLMTIGDPIRYNLRTLEFNFPTSKKELASLIILTLSIHKLTLAVLFCIELLPHP